MWKHQRTLIESHFILSFVNYPPLPLLTIEFPPNWLSECPNMRLFFDRVLYCLLFLNPHVEKIDDPNTQIFHMNELPGLYKEYHDKPFDPHLRQLMEGCEVNQGKGEVWCLNFSKSKIQRTTSHFKYLAFNHINSWVYVRWYHMLNYVVSEAI